MRTVGLSAALALVLGLTIPAIPAQSQATKDPLMEQVESLFRQANEEIEKFHKGGGKSDDPAHPVTKWIAALTEFREKNAGTRAAGRAASEIIHLLVHAGRFDEVLKRTDLVPADEPAWEFLPRVLLEAAANQKDHTYAAQKLESVLKQPAAGKFSATLHFSLGRAHKEKGDTEAAKAAFEAVIRLAPDSEQAREAQGLLVELANLGIGHPAPAVSARARDGSLISLASYRGKAVVLVFWAST